VRAKLKFEPRAIILPDDEDFGLTTFEQLQYNKFKKKVSRTIRDFIEGLTVVGKFTEYVYYLSRGVRGLPAANARRVCRFSGFGYFISTPDLNNIIIIIGDA